VLTREALTARVEAQRAALGERAGLFEDEHGKPVPWISSATPVEGEPSLDDDLLDSLPGSSGLGGGSMREAVNGNALGLFVPIEPEEASERPLQRFYEALDRLGRGEDDDGKVRVLVYGGSHTDADVYPHYLRTYLQQRFGDGGHGFVHIAKPWRWYGHLDYVVDGLAHWKTEHAQRRSGRMDGLYGLMGASLSARSKKAFGRVTPASGVVGGRYELYFLRQPRGGSFQLLADGKVVGKIKTRADVLGPGYHAFELPEGEHEIEVRLTGDGEVRMFGMTVEREGPGVVIDTLGIGGTRAANILTWDEAIWGDHVRRRDPDLITLFYGTNEANGTASLEGYESDLREVIARFATLAPRAACLLIGPGDFPEAAPDGSWLPRPRVTEIIETQRRVAADTGCGFWDTRAFMGGEMSMTRWATSEPAMAKADHIHFTRRGYVRIGMALVDAMMVAYDAGGAEGHDSAPPSTVAGQVLGAADAG
jgi:lysophospholipase L1-like esterase